MSIISALGHFANEYAAARTRYLTERQVRALPREIQKDIGWPDNSDRNPTRRQLGAWAGSR